MKIIYGLFLLFCSSVNAEIITTYTDIESYEAASARIGHPASVSDLQHYEMIVSQEVVGGPIIISRGGTVTEPGLFSRTRKAQMYGCLTRWANQVNGGTEQVLNSMAAMINDKSLINYCIEDIKALIKATQ